MTKITEYIKHGDKLKCTEAIPTKPLSDYTIIVTNSGNVKSKKKMMANSEDKEGITNIPSLGNCNLINNGAGTCVPNTTMLQWKKTKAGVTIGGKQALLKSSKLKCNVGGEISCSG